MPSPWWWLLVFVFALVVRLYILAQAPLVCCWDAFARLWQPESLFIRFWLPLPQFHVFLVHALGGGQLAIQLSFALVSLLAALCLGVFVAKWQSPWVGLSSFLLISLLPDLVKFSLAPYQEGWLLLMLGLFLLFWFKTRENGTLWSLALSSLFLALAQACRYEAWGFAILILFGVALGRKWRLLPVLFLPIAFDVLWLITIPFRNIIQGPPRLIALPTKTAIWELGVGELLSSALSTADDVFYVYTNLLLFLGVPLVFVGIIATWKNRQFLHKELSFFLLFLFLLAVARAVATSVINTRMMLTLVVLSVPYMIVGAATLLSPIKDRMRKPLLAGLLSGAVIALLHVNLSHVPKFLRMFEAEANAALALESLLQSDSEAASVEIRARSVPNVLQESTVGAIFAHSAKLNPEDSRWRFEGLEKADIAEDTPYLLYFDKSKKTYILRKRKPAQ